MRRDIHHPFIAGGRIMLSRRDFLKISGAGLLSLYAASRGKFAQRVFAFPIPGGTLDPLSVPKYQTPLLIPPVMPKAGTVKYRGQKIDYYEISMRQFQEQILPSGMPPTTVWGYGAVKSASSKGLLLHNAPSLTIEAKAGVPTRIKWINELVDGNGKYLPHLLPVDPTLHWANPPGGLRDRDSRPVFTSTPGPYSGPVPIVTHVHGAVGVGDESDGYAEAWYLPDARNIPGGYARRGTWYPFFAAKAFLKYGAVWGNGFSTFQFPNDNRASTIWYHDHALGMTRLNVYAGPAGFYIIRGGPAGDEAVTDSRFGTRAVLPGPAPQADDSFPPTKTYYEIPIAIQDRAFQADGSLFYPNIREFFDGYTGPYMPDTDVSPIWNPEFFGNMIMVNGNTWPYLNVEQRRYRFRLLNGCDSRFLVLKFDHPGVDVWQIGNEGGFLAAPVHVNDLDVGGHGGVLLMSLAERADIIVDFTNVPVGTEVILRNIGLDEPFGGFPIESPADPDTTGQVMQFRVGPATASDPTTPPQFLQLPAITPLPAEKTTRPLALLEMMSMVHDGPAAAMLGNLGADGMPMHQMWSDPVTENPAVGDTEVWEFYNFTADAHPMHVHEVTFEVVNREGLVPDPLTGEPMRPVQLMGNPRPPEPWENGRKDTVIAYPGEVTRIKAKFDEPGQFVWHCHIVSHEDNEMMRPYRIGRKDKDAPK
jgi:FtsP/CotA-like multicopper oxidase with cupredoxin domain